MLELPNGYGVRNGDHCYMVCIRVKKGKREGEYVPHHYFTTLSKAVNFCIDRGLVVPKSLEMLADEVEELKIRVETVLVSHMML
jgi:hypothetical protein